MSALMDLFDGELERFRQDCEAEQLLELYLHAFCQDRMLEGWEKNENCV